MFAVIMAESLSKLSCESAAAACGEIAVGGPAAGGTAPGRTGTAAGPPLCDAATVGAVGIADDEALKRTAMVGSAEWLWEN